MFGFIFILISPDGELFPALSRDLRELHCRLWYLWANMVLFAKSSEAFFLGLAMGLLSLLSLLLLLLLLLLGGGGVVGVKDFSVSPKKRKRKMPDECFPLCPVTLSIF